MEKNKYIDARALGEFICPIETIFQIIGGKWRSRILWELGRTEKSVRFGELQTALGDISVKVLTNHLRDLVALELIFRSEFAEFPRRVEYGLSGFGKTLKPIFGVTAEWIVENQDAVRKIIENNPNKDWRIKKRSA